MILQALNEYYERKSSSRDLAPAGFGDKEIPFLVVLSNEGTFLQLADTREKRGNKLVAKSFLVPKEKERSGSRAYEIANILWDHYGYVLGQSKSASSAHVEMANKQFESFRKLVFEIAKQCSDDISLRAVATFLSGNERLRVFDDPNWESCTKIPGCNLAFRIAEHSELVCQTEAVARYVANIADGDADSDAEDLPDTDALCMVTGKVGRLARVHPRTPLLGTVPSSKSNAKLVSFQKSCGFDSYGKQQSYNAPVSSTAAFNYTTALNHLLRKDSNQRLQVGDASTVFWGESNFEDTFAALFGAENKDDPDRGTQAFRNLVESTKNGVYAEEDSETRFCVLGLAPNAARIAVRFWQIGPVKDFALHIRQHFNDVEIDKPGYEKPYLSLYRILTSVALLSKAENIPPDLAGDTMRAILAGLPYPAMLLQSAIRRIRAEQEISYPRAAILKASINRLIRKQQIPAQELHMSLDKTNTDPGYRLGRLFAALERIQSAAQPGINATIRDRYYGAASSSPSSVFPILLKLKNHHLAKIDSPGLVTWFEKVLGEIFDGITGFSPHLNLAEQGLFAVGYYHQQQDFLAGRTKNNVSSAIEANHSEGEKFQ